MWTVPGLRQKKSFDTYVPPRVTLGLLPGRSQKFGTVVELLLGGREEQPKMGRVHLLYPNWVVVQIYDIFYFHPN